MKVCVYAIMRDEQENVDDWALTTAAADARFVLDTGSTDTTHDLLHSFEIEHQIATFIPFRFDDARNAALALAPPADVYVRLDADERLGEGWREQLEAAYHPAVSRYRVTVINHGNGWLSHTRDDVHRRAGHRWKYPTHEVLVGEVGPVRDTVIQVHHHPGARRPHHDANLDALREATIEYPGDHRMAFYYGRECWYAGHWDRCRAAMTYFLSLPNGWPAERAEALRILAAIDYEPERWLWAAIGESSQRREPWVDLARFYLNRGDVVEASMAYAFGGLCTDQTLYTTEQSAWGESFDALGDEIAKAA
jgi:glycosyltransferase involved in cell wall biosynthesis